MEDFIEGKSLISIRKMVEEHKDLRSSLTGCDAIPKMFGIGKGQALNVMKEKMYFTASWREGCQLHQFHGRVKEICYPLLWND